MKDQVLTGHVRWFKSRRGYGFINANEVVNEDGSSRDIFAHWSKINMEGYKTLNQGQKVSFRLVWNEDGNPQAEGIDLLDE